MFGDQVFGGSVTNIATYLLYAIIVILFLVACFKCLAPVSANTRALNRAIRVMRRDKGKVIRRNTWEKEDFLGNGSLKSSWRLFLDNELFADEHMQAPCNVEDYINEDSVINVPGRVSLAESVPGIFVSLGFLGTLIGLVISLANMSLGTFDEVSKSMLGMLGGLRYAFGTSIVGVLASITFTFLNRSVQGRARNALEEFTQIFQQDTDMRSVDAMTQIATYQQEQTRLLRNITGELQENLAARIHEAVASAFGPLAQSMDSFINATTFKQVEGVERIVNNFVSQMDQSLRGQFSNLARVMDETSRVQQDAAQAMQSALRSFSSVTNDITAVQRASQNIVEKFDAYMQSLEKAQRNQDSRSDSMAEQVEAMQKAARDQARYITQLQDYMAKLQTSLDQFTEQSAGFIKQLSDASGSSERALREAGSALENSANALSDASERHVGNLETNLANMLSTQQQNVAAITTNLQNTVAQIQQSIQDLPAIVYNSAHGYETEMAKFVESVRRLQRLVDGAMTGYGAQGDYVRR